MGQRRNSVARSVPYEVADEENVRAHRQVAWEVGADEILPRMALVQGECVMQGPGQIEANSPDQGGDGANVRHG